MNREKFKSTTSFFRKSVIELLAHFDLKDDHIWLKSVEAMTFSEMNLNIIEDMVSFKKHVGSGRVLDFGTGSGYVATLIAKNGFKVEAVDVDNYQEYERNHYNLLMTSDQKKLWKKLMSGVKNLSFKHYKNILPYKDNSFDGVCAYAVLEHVPIKKIYSVLKEIHRVLKPGGVLFVSRLPRKLALSEYLAKVFRLGGHERLFWDKEISDILINSKFKIINKTYQEALPAYPESVVNFLYPISKIFNKFLLWTPFKYFAHHLRLTSEANKSMEFNNCPENSTARKNLYHLISLLFIFLVALFVTYSNLGITKEIIGDDAGVSYHYSGIQWSLASNMWDSYIFPGRSNVIATVSLIHTGLIYLLNKSGITPLVVDRLYYFLFFFVSGLGLYFLAYNICRKLFNKCGIICWIASLSGALFYIFNNFTMILLSFPPTNYLYSYMLLPWLFLLYFKDFHLDNNSGKRIIFAITFLLILSGNPSNSISIIVLMMLYEIFFKKENKIIHNWRNFAITLILILLFSSFIFLPIIGNRGNPYGQVLGNEASIAYNSLNTSIDNLLRFRGHPAQDTYIFNQFLLRNRSIIANYLLLLFSLGFLLRKKISRIETFLFLIFVLFLFFAKATHSPFSSINEWLYANVPFFEMYRASYYKFIFFCAFSFSLLLSISLVVILKKILRLRLPIYFNILICIFPLFIIIFSASPFFQGEIMNNIHKTIIPAEYRKVSDYFSSIKEDFSVLSLPQMSIGTTLDWGNGNYYGSAGNPEPYLLGRPVWTNGWFLTENPISNEFSFYKNFLGRTNVRYIFLHKDIPESYYFKVKIKGSPKGQTKYKLLDEQISKDSDFTLIEDNKYFKIYEIKEGKYGFHFEIPSKSIVSDQYAEDLLKVDLNENWPADTAVYFQKQNSSKNQILDLLPDSNSMAKPTLEYKKISPTKYRIKVHGASGQFPLIFNESFQNGWKIYLVDNEKDNADGTNSADNDIIENNNLKNRSISETWFKKPAKSSSNQLMVNAYANSWIIDPSTDCGSSEKCLENPDGTYDMELIIEFWPQRLFYLGVGISGLTLLYCLGQLIYNLLLRRKQTLGT